MIHSFNSNKPFDQFGIEQLAGEPVAESFNGANGYIWFQHAAADNE
ncbi:MAG: hypothetical protein R3C20_03235 [Planctomycetaceae bacterium]